MKAERQRQLGELVDRLDDGLRVAIKLLNDARASRKPYMDMFNKED